MLFVENLIWFSYYPCEEGATVTPNLQIRQLRHGDEVARLGLSTTVFLGIGEVPACHGVASKANSLSHFH